MERQKYREKNKRIEKEINEETQYKQK